MVFGVWGSVVVEVGDGGELVDDERVEVVLGLGGVEGMCGYGVFVWGEVREVGGDEGVGYELGELVVVIEMVIVFVYGE